MSDPLRRLIAELGRLPGIGPKTAARLAHYLIRVSDEDARDLEDARIEYMELFDTLEHSLSYPRENIQVGAAFTTQSTVAPMQVLRERPFNEALSTRATHVAVAGSHACARTESGRVRCWGINSAKQLGFSREPANSRVPAESGDVPFLGP